MQRLYALILSVGVAVIALDQWTKNLALDVLQREGETRSFLPWFSFTLVHNPGAAFGMFRNLPDGVRLVFFMLLPPVVLFTLWWFYIRKMKANDKFGAVTMGLVLGGALGNFIDRIRFEYVIDFIDWHFPWEGSCPVLFHRALPGYCHWPKFNVADSAITVAMVLLLIQAFFLERAKAKRATTEDGKNTAKTNGKKTRDR